MARRMKASRKKQKRKTAASGKRRLKDRKEFDVIAEKVTSEVLSKAKPSPEGHAKALHKLEPESSVSSETPKKVVAALQRQKGNIYVQEVMEKAQAQRSSGVPLSDKVRKEMEDKLGQKLDGVRIHTGSEADQISTALGAKSLAAGQDVFFRSGAFSPDTKQGKELLAHELAHVVQQGGKGTAPLSWKDEELSITYQLEQQAQRVARLMGEGRSVGPTDLGPSGQAQVPGVQMQKERGEAEEPPKLLKDPKDSLEKVLKDWTKSEKGKTGVSQMKTAALTEKKLPEKVLLGVGATLAAMLADEMKVPKQAFDLIPEIDLAKDVKLKIKPIWKGALGKAPKEWGGTVTLTIRWK